MNFIELYKEITAGQYTIKHKRTQVSVATTYTYILSSADSQKRIFVSKTRHKNIPIPARDRIEYDITGIDHICNNSKTEYYSPVAEQLFNLITQGRSSR